MKNKLQNYFPMIRTRGEILEEIRENKKMWKTFCNWEEKQQQEYLDICTGVKGVKLLYDTYFKAIMNPDTKPERFNEFLSEILGKKIKILKVLPNESVRIAAESSLLIMDIVVQFEDGSIANVEVQKIGYLFPGQRSACYSSDLLLRQYKRVREELGKAFTYKKIQKVYTIVLFEKSSADFHKFSKEVYIHHFEQKSDTGVKIDLLQEYTFICLDIFNDIIQNKDRKIKSRLEEWLVFLSQDDPDMIIKLLKQNPGFQKIYEEVYTLCLNMERMMEMFSKELEILDRNTVKLMIDQMKEELEQVKADAKKSKADAEKVKADAEKSKADAEKKKADIELERADLERQKEQMSEQVGKEKQRADRAEKEVEKLRKQLEELQHSL